jgi:hypothetical protein
MNKFVLTAVAVLSFYHLTTVQSAAAPMPEFGASVQFDKSGPDINMSKLRGKAVLVIFFQSWCGICNGWSPKMLKQVEEAHGDNRALVLVAIKTDGGGIAGAKDYLKSKGADLAKWCVGSDDGATFYKQVTGKDELWNYVLVGAGGEIVKHDKAGSYFTSGPDNGKYALAAKDLLKDCGKLETVLPAGKQYPPEAGKFVRLAEFGSLGKALTLCAAAGQSDLKQDILQVVETRMKQRMDILKDVSKDGPSRYDAYKELGALVKDCPAVSAANEVNSMLVKANGAPVIQKEKNAETEYLAITQKMQKANKRDKQRLLEDLALLAKKYEGTKYGLLAGTESQAAQK